MSTYIDQIINSSIFSEWHWFHYHFSGLPSGEHSPFSLDFLNKLSLIERKIPGFSEKTIIRLASYSGKEQYEPHYEQLIQLLVEIVIFYRLAEGFILPNVKFHWEPTMPTSAKNPELLLEGDGWKTLIEVKCPSILKHSREAAKNDTRLGARIGDPKIFDNIANSKQATRPLDNKIKDFLMSAESKFKPFKDEDSTTSSLLIIAWSEHLFESTSPLINGMSGLFTENSFYKNGDGEPVAFASVDSVLVTEHLELVLRATREELLPYGYSSALDFGAFIMPSFLPPAHIMNPLSNMTANEAVLKELGAVKIEDISDPRVSPLDYVMWFKRPY
jgi:hypothetical protein